MCRIVNLSVPNEARYRTALLPDICRMAEKSAIRLCGIVNLSVSNVARYRTAPPFPVRPRGRYPMPAAAFLMEMGGERELRLAIGLDDGDLLCQVLAEHLKHSLSGRPGDVSLNVHAEVLSDPKDKKL